MKKILLFLTALLCLFNTAFAEQPQTPETETTPPAAETRNKEENESDIKILLNSEKVREEMQKGVNNNCYLEIEEDKFIAYKIDTEDEGTRRDLFKKAPAERVNHLLTNNENIYKHLTEFIASRDKSGRKYYGYRITGGIEENAQLPDGSIIYKFWFMKLDESSGRTDIPVDIGIGIGRHHGPWVGIGW